MRISATAVVVCVVLAVSLLQLLRTRRIREKYAAVWIVLVVAVVLIGVFPELAFWLSRLVGVQTPSNLVFALAIVVLLAVSVQLSTEVSSLEEETRTLAEELALLRLEVHKIAHPASTDPDGTSEPADAGTPPSVSDTTEAATE